MPFLRLTESTQSRSPLDPGGWRPFGQRQHDECRTLAHYSGVAQHPATRIPCGRVERRCRHVRRKPVQVE